MYILPSSAVCANFAHTESCSNSDDSNMLGNDSPIHAKKLSHCLLGTPKGFIPDDYLYLAFLFRKIV